jgi:hypothetical protein
MDILALIVILVVLALLVKAVVSRLSAYNRPIQSSSYVHYYSGRPDRKYKEFK